MKRRSRLNWAKEEARAADEALLRTRLELLGIKLPVVVHENRSVLVSVTQGGVVRIHRGFAYASDRTLQAVVRFSKPSTRRPVRQRAEQEVISFAVHEYVPLRRLPGRRARQRPGDGKLLAELRAAHDRLNGVHFGGTLSPIRFRISDRMKTRLGELTLAAQTHRVAEIAISRRHLSQDSWGEVEDTILHEMIHQWQAERGLEVDHGSAFRAKARELGVRPRANRAVGAVQGADHRG
ncbi:MAG: hypothetical protein AMS18_08340 [Gemmatimonas sp. SG8_17]|nr:MAG: hypothetical protein AMS18_08340 [Gemmatimonas sp. SG8_17]